MACDKRPYHYSKPYGNPATNALCHIIASTVQRAYIFAQHFIIHDAHVYSAQVLHTLTTDDSFTPHPQSITTVLPLLVFHPAEDTRLS